MTEAKSKTKLAAKVGCIVFFIVPLSVVILFFVFRFFWSVYEDISIDAKYDFAMQQCEKYGGQQGELPVITEGVFDTKRGPRSADILLRAATFINNGLQFVEFNKEVVSLTGSDYPKQSPYFKNTYAYFDYYRAYVAEKGDPLCEPYEKKGYKYYEQAVLGENACVAIKGFDDPALLKAPYQLLVADKIINEGVAVEWNNLQIKHIKTDTVVASYNTFSYCFTSMAKHASEGFSYCRGSYSNEKVRPKCPAEYAKSSLVIGQFEKTAFKYEKNTQ